MFRPRLEVLEHRCCPCSNNLLDDGTLLILGDDADDHIAIRDDSFEGGVTVLLPARPDRRQRAVRPLGGFLGGQRPHQGLPALGSRAPAAPLRLPHRAAYRRAVLLALAAFSAVSPQAMRLRRSTSADGARRPQTSPTRAIPRRIV